MEEKWLCFGYYELWSILLHTLRDEILTKEQRRSSYTRFLIQNGRAMHQNPYNSAVPPLGTWILFYFKHDTSIILALSLRIACSLYATGILKLTLLSYNVRDSRDVKVDENFRVCGWRHAHCIDNRFANHAQKHAMYERQPTIKRSESRRALI